MKVYFIVLIILVQFVSSSAQIIHGKITSSDNGEVLAGVSVIADSTNGVTSDSLGHYLISLTPGSHTLRFNLITFQPVVKIVDVKNESTELNIKMHSKQLMLQTVVISAGKFEQKIENVTVSMAVSYTHLTLPTILRV